MKDVGYYGNVTGTVSVSSGGTALRCGFSGKFSFVIFIADTSQPPPPLGNGLPVVTPSAQPDPAAAAAEAAATARIPPNSVFGSMMLRFTAQGSNEDFSAQGGGRMEYAFAGTYDPAAHNVTVNSGTITGMQIAGTGLALTFTPPKTLPISIVAGGYLGTLAGVPNTGQFVMGQHAGDDPTGLVSGAPPQFDSNVPSDLVGRTLALDLTNKGQQTLTVTVPDPGGPTRVIVWNLTLTPYQIDIDASPQDLDPTTSGTAAVTITATTNGQPAKYSSLQIEVCTKLGVAGGSVEDDQHAPDGHIHDGAERGDPCDHSNPRPSGTLTDPSGAEHTSADFPFQYETDGTGTIKFTYTPANEVPGHGISGVDVIKVSLPTDPNVKNQQTITTWVKGLVPMPAPADTTYYFPPGGQPAHPGQYYGTPSTVSGLQGLASACWAAQNACIAGQTYPADGGTAYSLPQGAKGLRITAMCLPWGGVNDIGPRGAATGVEWAPPHYTHNDGMEVDIGWADFVSNGQLVGDYASLFQQVILNTVGPYALPYPDEGGSISMTLASPKGPHFHVKFPG